MTCPVYMVLPGSIVGFRMTVAHFCCGSEDEQVGNTKFREHYEIWQRTHYSWGCADLEQKGLLVRYVRLLHI